MAMAFGVSEILINIEQAAAPDILKTKIKGILPTLLDWMHSIGAILRGSSHQLVKGWRRGFSSLNMNSGVILLFGEGDLLNHRCFRRLRLSLRGGSASCFSSLRNSSQKEAIRPTQKF
jgi:hypothetical protein